VIWDLGGLPSGRGPFVGRGLLACARYSPDVSDVAFASVVGFFGFGARINI
jgi:hypothetical protein